LRCTIAGKRRSRGLGSHPLISLDGAREQAIDIRRAARNGQDLAGERRQTMVTFREAAEAYYEIRKRNLTNPKHLVQWPSTMEMYVYPRIGDRPVASVTHADVIEVLKDIWHQKNPTAKRILNRMGAVFTSAILRGQRQAASPCLGVAQELGVKRREVEHFKALPHREMPAFIQMLRSCGSDPMTRLAFEFLIMTATRSGETRGARKDEILGQLWVIPATRMKGRREHRVPLSNRSMEIVKEARALAPDNPLLFPGRRGRPLSDMAFSMILRESGVDAVPHGLRSTFRDWCTEIDKCREPVSEAALAHAVRGVEGAYRRSDYLAERTELMQRWASYCVPG
jgi:integrase